MEKINDLVILNEVLSKLAKDNETFVDVLVNSEERKENLDNLLKNFTSHYQRRFRFATFSLEDFQEFSEENIYECLIMDAESYLELDHNDLKDIESKIRKVWVIL